jgi:AcrR family transcriptional regulator
MSVWTRTAPEDAAKASSSDADARREAVLDAALAVISRTGDFHQASIGAIAARAHVSRATIYHHSIDKQDILVALADRSARRITEAADAWEPLPPRGRDRAEGGRGHGGTESELRRMIETRIAKILTVIAANADAVRLLVQLARGDDRRLDAAVRRLDDHIVGILGQDIRIAIGEGWVRPCDPEAVARFLIGGIEKLVVGTVGRYEPVALDVQALVREIGDMIFAALAHPDLRSPSRPA